MTEWSIYWILKLDSIIAYTGGVAVFTGLLLIGACILLGVNIVGVLEKAEGAKKYFKFTIPFLAVALFCLISFSLASYLLPTTKEYLVIKGVSYVTSNERIVTTADKIFDGVEEYIDKRLGELNEGEHNDNTK